MAMCKLQMQSYPGLRLGTTTTTTWRQREKVVIVMGATGTGKSRLSVDLATTFSPAEIINSDKMQIYEGLEIVTNKISPKECRGVPHHLLGTLTDPDQDYDSSDFRLDASRAVEDILARDRVPILAGGSNSFVEDLVEKNLWAREYDLLFLWVDVAMRDLHSRVSGRVDEMVMAGMVDEAESLFDPKRSQYDRGLRRAIGVPEFDRYFRVREGGYGDDERLLREAVREVKDNTCKLACRQVSKIRRLGTRKGWRLHRLDATEACRVGSELTWQRTVFSPAAELVRRFLYGLSVADYPSKLARPRTVTELVTVTR